VPAAISDCDEPQVFELRRVSPANLLLAVGGLLSFAIVRSPRPTAEVDPLAVG